MSKEKKDIYHPFAKNHFRKIWFNFDTKVLEPFKIIRQLTDKEKEGFEANYDYSEEMYLIQNNRGEQCEVFDEDILEECKIHQEQWFEGLINLIEGLKDNNEAMEEFIKQCKIENYILKNY